MLGLLIAPLAIQGAVMIADEALCHRRRGLPRWERIGHPLDTLTVALCVAWLVAMPPGRGALAVYLGLAVFSTLFVTKDEPVHARLCGPGEHWLHALLFALHPIAFAALGVLWWTGGHGTLLAMQLVVTLGFGAYQAVYWNLWRARDPISAPRAGEAGVDNEIYGALGERWYEAHDDPVALLRAESRHRNPWIAETIAAIGAGPHAVLDVGCGAGYLANYLAERGHRVTGLDTSAEALAVARRHDRTHRVEYTVGDACALPFVDARFDAVCAMDLIEHVQDADRLVAEAARVLRPGGLLFFHTFNRTWQAHLIVIKGVEWFVANTPRNLHVIELFRSPEEISAMCRRVGLEPAEIRGSRPRLGWPLWRMLATGEVGDDLAFRFTRSTKLGYTGYARLAVADQLPR
ncbi:MAG TPA: bifunctional 2-polyprenyl-6-hydroxyphenol methylase/3-demethylubiquinol 3-O-methyltransferase UbiG [Kofleriaceae bacterium]|nr:bifunctional 2-polyprenyl-6-hydroxyphenol methylase/3-demethylubiquinol 3-O-methyltransferase UbiG [Kofleriaceae bacterium]